MNKAGIGFTMPYLYKGQKKCNNILIIAHGAGAPMDSEWMEDLVKSLAHSDLLIARFEFPYMQKRRDLGKKSPPNPKKILLESWTSALLDHSNYKNIYISGKSMGGRIASLIADENKVKGLICFGYPFHPPGRPIGDRIEHLKNLKTKTLILQGERDPFGDKSEVSKYDLSKKIKMTWIPDGDHSFKPRKKSGYTIEQNLKMCAEKVHQFIGFDKQ